MEYVFFAGANGSGKSTLIKNLQRLDEYQGFRYICADELEKESKLQKYSKIERMKVANSLAKKFRENHLKKGKNLIYESVASHPSHLQDLDRIKAMGYKITTIYVTTESPEINLARIAKRGRDNDTYLTEERVRGRHKRSLDLLSEIIKRSDVVFAFDNSINYFATFYKTVDGKNYLIGEREWVKHYIVEKLQNSGIQVYTAKDLDKETYIRLLAEANRLIEVPEKKQVEQDNKAEDIKESLTDKDRELLARISKTPIGVGFNKLFTGQDNSKTAKEQLLHMLAFFTEQNPIQMARIYKASALYEPSKDELVLSGAISKVLKTYSREQRVSECSHISSKSNDHRNEK